MEIKVLIVGVIKKEDQILLRKKPAGSQPYKETWYLFSGELNSDRSPETIIREIVEEQAGINIKMIRPLTWDTEIKVDHDGISKNFVYIFAECEYINGELQKGDGIERLEWVETKKLYQYDHVPPSVILFKKLGYLE